MKKVLFSALLAASFSQNAFADCWMQCMARNPFTGKCIAKTKMCNGEDMQSSIEHLGKDVGAMYSNLRDEWVNLYGRLPEQLQTVLDKYPLTFATLILPGTREYTLVTLALEEYAGRAKARSAAVAAIIQHAPDWKIKILHDGEALILMLEGMDITGIDWTSPNAGSVPDRYSTPFNRFLSCVQNAGDIGAGNQCLADLKKDSLGIL